MTAPLRVVVVYPDLLGTYGDGGNGLILTRRAQWRGIEAELAQASSDAPLPEADIYCLGGGEDGPQVRAARALIDDRTLVRRVDAGAVVLAVCAGYQIVGTTFPRADGTPHEGVGLLGLTTSKGEGSRAVGEVTAEVTATTLAPATLPTLTGFENHGGVTKLAEGITPLARMTRGVGNGDGSGTEGAVTGRVMGTYLHGPVLARNPAMADLLLAWALDTDTSALMPLDDSAHESLRLARLGPHRVGATGRKVRHRVRRRNVR
jgi:lipid II isoglutaminyl synthase (glutamine-hydrolysing)